MFIFNSFFAFGNVTMLSVSMFQQDQRKEAWRRGAQGGRVKKQKKRKNNFVQAPLVCSHIVIKLHRERGGGWKCFGHHLVVFPANPHNLLLSAGSGGLSVWGCACVFAFIVSTCTCVGTVVFDVCGQSLNPYTRTAIRLENTAP